MDGTNQWHSVIDTVSSKFNVSICCQATNFLNAPCTQFAKYIYK